MFHILFPSQSPCIYCPVNVCLVLHQHDKMRCGAIINKQFLFHEGASTNLNSVHPSYFMFVPSIEDRTFCTAVHIFEPSNCENKFRENKLAQQGENQLNKLCLALALALALSYNTLWYWHSNYEQWIPYWVHRISLFWNTRDVCFFFVFFFGYRRFHILTAVTIVVASLPQ